MPVYKVNIIREKKSTISKIEFLERIYKWRKKFLKRRKNNGIYQHMRICQDFWDK